MKRTSPIAFCAVLLAASGVWAQGPNERVHVLQKRDYSVKSKLELTLFGGLTVGDVFTRQVCAALAVDYHIDEAFALEFLWLTSKVPFFSGDRDPSFEPAAYRGDDIRWGNHYTEAYDELKDDALLRPSPADLSMIGNYVGLNVQFSPLYGKWTLFGSTLGHADFYLTAGGGLAATEFRNSAGLWQDTGIYFAGSFGMGFRIFLDRWLAVRLDVRDYAYAARVREARPGGSVDEESTKIRNTLFVMLGISLLFLGEEPVQIWSPY